MDIRGASDNFKFNQETEFVPILGIIESKLNAQVVDEAEKEEKKGEESIKVPAASSAQEYHHPALLRLLADELSLSPDEIHDFEL